MQADASGEGCVSQQRLPLLLLVQAEQAHAQACVGWVLAGVGE
jgi:hypothetical protein